MRRILTAALAAAAFCYAALPASAACDRVDDTSAFVQGAVNGTWVGLVLMYDGTNGGATTANAYASVPGGNGMLTKSIGKITAVTRHGDSMDGDRMSGFVRNGRLYVTNAVYGSGEAHCCATHIAARQYTFANGKLVQQASAIVATASLGSAMSGAGDTCAARDKQQREYEDAIISTISNKKSGI